MRRRNASDVERPLDLHLHSEIEKPLTYYEPRGLVEAEFKITTVDKNLSITKLRMVSYSLFANEAPYCSERERERENYSALITLLGLTVG
jgi:hypothetical protein